jgi:putative ABC transport system ATP-binding protein
VSGIKLRSVTKTYNKGSGLVHVLENISLEILEGAFVAITGPSGSGKSTLLNLIAGLDRPTSGEVEVAGQSIDRFTARQLSGWRARNIGFVFQMYNLLPALNARENVEVPLLLHRFSAAERKARSLAALKLVGLAERTEHKITELSGGQMQRVAIARAIVVDPPILVCDEPTGDLDRKSTDETLELLSSLNSRHHKTIVMVTHDDKAAAYAGTHVMLDKGSLQTLLSKAVA